jgi:hypothetical protein
MLLVVLVSRRNLALLGPKIIEYGKSNTMISLILQNFQRPIGEFGSWRVFHDLDEFIWFVGRAD